MFWNAFLIALREIRRNLTRAFLTVLGVIIGVSAVITMVTLGQGTTQAVKNQISNLGSNLVMVFPGVRFGPSTGSAPSFTAEDASLIAEQIGGVAATAPVRSASLSTIFQEKARRTSVTGSTSAYFDINKWKLADGRFFTDTEARSGAAVCLIGNTVRKELFGTDNPIGAKIRLGKASCEVIGLLATKGQMGMGDQDDTIIVPLATIQRRLAGHTSNNDINMICVSAAEGASSDEVIAGITSLLRERRSLGSNEDNNFSIMDTRQIAETLSSSTKMMTMLLAAVAGVSLLVGGIGIMNIMLVSVTERTREIGIRLSIGATTHEVLLQFLVEAVTLSCAGGVAGIVFAFGLCFGLSQIIHVPYAFNVQINVIAFIFSAAVGIAFGFTPARRAARLDPINALRHE
jgi:putative ABC transport system permease protein